MRDLQVYIDSHIRLADYWKAMHCMAAFIQEFAV